MNKRFFGRLTNGEEIYAYTLKAPHTELDVMNFGAIIVAFRYCGTDVAGGFDTLDGYIADDSHQGGLIGRVANRVGGASFDMDGVTYPLPDNDNGNCLHGGCGFDRRVWTVEACTEDSITLSYTSEDGEEGFPASIYVRVRYTLTRGAVRIDYEAIPDGKTPISLTNHTYFNVDGFGGVVDEQMIRINADSYTEVGEDLIPTGARPRVDGTAYDLRVGRIIRDASPDGFDHNFILNHGDVAWCDSHDVRLAAEVWGKRLVLRVYTDQPCIQFYTGNFLGGGPDFKGGIKQVRHGALCLEAQVEPNCIKRGESFYDRGEVYRQSTVYELVGIGEIC